MILKNQVEWLISFLHILPLKLKEKQDILDLIDVKERINRVIEIIHNEKEVLNLEKKIGQRVKKSMERTQKEYYLREQMKAIQKELGDKEGKTGEIAESNGEN